MNRIEPNLDINEKICPNIYDIKIGQRMEAIINYKVVEKTKSYIVLRVLGTYIINDRRVY